MQTATATSIHGSLFAVVADEIDRRYVDNYLPPEARPIRDESENPAVTQELPAVES